MNFTEGKWECNWHAEGQFLGLRQSGCYVICEKPKKGKETVQAIAMLPPGHEANAHLIAAAPELYRACKEARLLHLALSSLEVAARFGDNYQPPTDEDCLRVRGILEAALSSARGGK
jgi:hypothetical protein